jgi:hypothetical protein
MIGLASLLASTLYLLPIAVLVAARWSRERPIEDLAALIPVGVAVDLLTLLLLTRVVRLDVAIVASRLVWAAAGAVWWALRRRRRGDRQPSPGLPARDAIVLAVAALLTFTLSAWLSRRYAIWDRQWHIPLVTSLRGQSIPFVNVSEPAAPLHYHVTGDVLAATLQALSGARLHASLALSLAHDILFALAGVAVAALLARRGRGRGWAVLAAISPLVVLLAGPPPVSDMATGLAVFNNYQMSYRPHTALAMLLIVGIVATALPLLRPPAGPSRPFRLGSLLVLLAALVATDEPSVAIIAPALALVLVRRRGAPPLPLPRAAVLGSLAAIVLLALLVLPSTLAPGTGPSARLVVPRVPSFFVPSLPLASPRGLLRLTVDLAPMLAILLLLAALAVRTRRSDVAALLGLDGAVLALGILLLTCVQAGESPGESHRFMTLPQVLLPLSLLLAIEAAPVAMRVLIALALIFPATFTAAWDARMESAILVPDFLPDSFARGIHAVDCRRATGARLFERAQATYAPKDEWYMWTGCRPVLAPSEKPPPEYLVNSKRPIFGAAALDAFEQRFLPQPGLELRVACPTGPQSDAVCRFALARGRCEAAGTRWQWCALGSPERGDLRSALAASRP